MPACMESFDGIQQRLPESILEFPTNSCQSLEAVCVKPIPWKTRATFAGMPVEEEDTVVRQMEARTGELLIVRQPNAPSPYRSIGVQFFA